MTHISGCDPAIILYPTGSTSAPQRNPRIYAGILYVLNLPFLELAFRSSFYANRFESIFHIEKDRVELL
jgi:hypothetical protein